MNPSSEPDRIDELEAALARRDELLRSVVEELDGLVTAMRSRATIEQAKGIIMATAGCGPREAFELLIAQSQHENRKLRVIAAELVAQQARRPPSRQPSSRRSPRRPAARCTADPRFTV